MNVPQTVKRLKAAAKSYYDGSPTMDDDSFDALKEQLRAADPKNPFLFATGAPVEAAQKIQHAIRLGSLENAFTLEDVQRWVNRCKKLEKPPKMAVIQPKEDGLTVNVSYRGGKFVHAATRGDGAEGEDVSANVREGGRVPQELLDDGSAGEGALVPWDVDVRCEAILSREDFEKYLKPLGYTNARSAAAGVLRNKKGGLAKHLHLRAFSMAAVGGERLFKYESAMIDALSNLGFETVECDTVPLDADALFAAAQEYNTNRVNRPYESDGFVVKVNHVTSQEALGWSGNCPVGCIAIKWRGSMTAETTITGLSVQVGKTGRITPVAHVAPVLCGGVTITRVSLMNWGEVVRLGVCLGAKVLIERAGEVIPAVREVINPKLRCSQCGFVGDKSAQEKHHATPHG